MTDQVLLTTTVGSFGKPDYLQKARNAHARGELARAELYELERRRRRSGSVARRSSASTSWSTARCTAATWSRTSPSACPGFAHRGPVRSYGNRYYRKPIIAVGGRASEADDRRLVELRAVADGPPGEGDAHRPVHDDGLVLQRALPVARAMRC